jgi:hypothetical protein
VRSVAARFIAVLGGDDSTGAGWGRLRSRSASRYLIPQTLFRRLDTGVVDEELNRMERIGV